MAESPAATGRRQAIEAERVQKQASEPATINLTHGHSKDRRPDLKQLMLSPVMTGDRSSMPPPLFVEIVMQLELKDIVGSLESAL